MRWVVVAGVLAASATLLAAMTRPVRRLAWMALNYVFDYVSGIETTRLASVRASDSQEDASFGYYEPSGLPVLLAVFRRLVIAPDDVFVDFGSGKGRVIFWAARYPFKRVIGVELSEALNQIARANLARNRSRLKCQDIQFVTADATTYTVPDDATVAYCCIPYGSAVFGRIVENISASLKRCPRAFRIICPLPAERGVLQDNGFSDDVAIGWGARMYMYQLGGSGPRPTCAGQ